MNDKSIELKQESNRFLLSTKGVAICGFIAMYIALFGRNFLSALKFGLNDWVFTDWLVNYTSGFVRRGLGGSILLYFAEGYNLDVHTFISVFTYLIYLIVSCFYLKKIIQNYRFLDLGSLAVFLLLPSLLLFPILDSAALGRKEILFLIPLIINLSFVEKNFNKLSPNKSRKKKTKYALSKYCKSILIWFNLISIPLALIHESIIFLCLPVNIIITVSFLRLKLSKKNAVLTALVICSPTLITVAAGFVWKGNASIALNICESWQSFASLECGKEAPAAIGAIGWSLQKGVSLAWKIVRAKHGFLLAQWLMLFGLNLILLIFSSTKLISNLLSKFDLKKPTNSSSKTKQVYSVFSLKYIIIPMLFSIPLYILGWDWGRWFYISAISYSFCCLSPSLIHLEASSQALANDSSLFSLLWQKSTSIYSKTTNRFFYLLKRYFWVYAALLTYVLFFVNIPHCCLADSVFRQGLFGKIISIF